MRAIKPLLALLALVVATPLAANNPAPRESAQPGSRAPVLTLFGKAQLRGERPVDQSASAMAGARFTLRY